eukprot:scaffold182385_cov35-Tisochrysis_lutea.AAC.3
MARVLEEPLRCAASSSGKRQSRGCASASGKKPASMENRQTPSDHKSASKPSYPSPNSTWGAMYDFDPTSRVSRSLLSSRPLASRGYMCDSPKSIILTVASVVSNTFSSFRSQCATPLSCR